jgi:hypothetical protein
MQATGASGTEKMTMKFKCFDEGFMDFTPPSGADLPCTDFTLDKENAKKALPSRCKGEVNELLFPEFSSWDDTDLTTKYSFVTSGVFSERRHVLINLYAFDGTRTEKIEPPKLVLTNVDFKYFIKDYEALIYVENNNFHSTTAAPADDRLISLHGEDRGVDMTITGTKVIKSRFCKGMLVYYSRKS